MTQSNPLRLVLLIAASVVPFTLQAAEPNADGLSAVEKQRIEQSVQNALKDLDSQVAGHHHHGHYGHYGGYYGRRLGHYRHSRLYYPRH
ncbi:MAG: hypothetical protein N2C14_02445, partial [Planctomycetales bacterium]